MHYPVEGTKVQYGSTAGNRQQDTLVFIENPTEVWERAKSAERIAVTPPGVGVSWSGCEQDSCTDKRDVSATLSCAEFRGAGVCKDGNSEVLARAYFSYDRGACSKRMFTSELLQTLVDEATQEMRDEVAEGDPGLAWTESYQYASAQTAIWGLEENQARGGFQLNFKLDISTTGFTFTGPCPFCLPIWFDYDAAASVTGRYEWYVNGEGVVSVRRVGGRTHRDFDSGSVYFLFGLDRPLGEKLEKALVEDVPAGLAERARALQIREIPKLNGKGPYECSAPSDCAERGGALTTLDVGVLASPIENAEADPIREELKRHDQWICDRACDGCLKTCKMLVRAKRVNVYPDSVELVFREAGGYPAVRESAIELTLGLAGSRNELCDLPTRGKIARGFTSVSQERSYD